jgi:hypothetical protein
VQVKIMADRTKLLVIGGSVLVVLLVLMPLLGWAFGGGGGWPAGGWGMGPWMMWGAGGWWFMPIFMVLFWGLVIWGVVAAVQAFSRSSGTGLLAGGPDTFYGYYTLRTLKDGMWKGCSVSTLAPARRGITPGMGLSFRCRK